MTTISATAHNYTATLDCATGRVSIADKHGHWAGDGHWNGHAIEDCAAILGGPEDDADDIYAGLDRALALAVAEAQN